MFWSQGLKRKEMNNSSPSLTVCKLSANSWLTVYQQTADSPLIYENISFLKVLSCYRHRFFVVVFIVNHCCSFLPLKPQSWVQEFSMNTLLILAL